MTASSGLVVVQAAYDAVRDRDLPRLLALFDEDCVFVDIPTGSVAHGRDALAAYMEDQWRAVPDFHVASASFVTDGERVAAELELAGTHAGDLLGVAPTHRHISWAAAAFYCVDRERATITRETYYYDVDGLRAGLRAAR